MAKKKLSAVIRRDYLVAAFSGSTLLFWLAAAGMRLILGGSFGYTLAAAAVTIVAVPLTLLRLARVSRLLKNGKGVRGEVRHAFYQGIRGRLEFSYSANGKDYFALHPFLRSPNMPRLNPGTTIRVLIDPRAPYRATVPAIFEAI